MDYIDLIKSKLLLSEIISEKVKLTRNKNNYIGLCPFHNEKIPSFFVNDIKGIYHCFGCSAHGDIFSFISQTENLNFKETVKKLALIANIDLSEKKRFSNKEEDELFTILNLATNWFLEKNKSILFYLEERNISHEIINKFQIGYAPKFGLKKYLNSCGFQDKTLISIGLINNNLCDYFADRLIFPIHNVSGKVVGFGGRALNFQKQPKYLNSKENKLFKKKENLYGLTFALNEIRKKQCVFIVEGYMDAIALHQAKISNTIAVLGTAISPTQIENLWKFAKEIFICMDGDSAGFYAANRVAESILPILQPGYTLKFITLPDNKDPYDICYQLKYKTEKILSLFEKLTKLHSEYLWHYVINSTKGYENSTPEKYSILEYKFMKYINSINRNSIRKYYRDYLYIKINELGKKNFKKHILNNSIEKILNNGEYMCNKSPEFIEEEQNQSIVLRIVIEFPEKLQDPIFFEQFSYFEFIDDKMKVLHQYIIDIVNNGKKFNKESLIREFNQSNNNTIIKYIFEKTKILNDQLNISQSADLLWRDLILRRELKVLKEEIFKARLNGNFTLELKLVEQMKKVESNIYEMQMSLIQENKKND